MNSNNDTGLNESAAATQAAPADARDKVFDPVMTARGVSVNYGDKCAVRNVTLDIGRNQVLALIGPSSQIFTSPKDRRTDDYFTGRFG